jgi:hypothetical protein
VRGGAYFLCKINHYHGNGTVRQVLDWAAMRGSRSGPNPARFDGHIEHLLANR